MKSPILLSPQSLGQSFVFVNPFRSPILIDELRFYGFFGRSELQFGAQVDIRLGREPLTNGWTDVLLLGELANNYNNSNNQQMLGWRPWTFLKPLYLPPGEELTIKVLGGYDSSDSGANAQVWSVKAAGRRLFEDDPIPDVLHIPWVSSFISKANNGLGTHFTNTTPADLVNPFNETLHVQRFVGLHNMTYLLPARAMRSTTIQAADSFGNILIRDPTSFTSIFTPLHLSWTVHATLQPKGFYLFSVLEDYAAYSGAFTSVQWGLSLVGYRQVALKSAALGGR